MAVSQGGFLDLLNQGGATGGGVGFFSNLINGLANGLINARSPLANDINSGGYGSVMQGAGPSLPANISGPVPLPQPRPDMAAALPPPTNIASLPVASPQAADIPPKATPAQYAPQAAPQAPQSPAQLPSFLSGGGDFLDGLKNRIAGGLSIMNPQAGQAYMQQQIMHAVLPQLLQQTGGDLPRALALLQNPKLQEQIYGNPTSLGEMKAGNVSVPVYAQGGKVGYAAGGGQAGLNNLVQFGNQVTQSNAAAEAAGKAQGTNAVGLPQALAQADQAISLIDNIKNDPALSKAIGPIAGRLPAMGGEQANVVAKIDQLRGQAFLQAWQALKGAGARITNTESMKATDAIGRLQRTQSPEGFNQALSDLRDVIVGVRTRAGVMAGGEPTPPPAPQATAPSQGTVTATNPQTGQRLMLKGNQWVPMQ